MNVLQQIIGTSYKKQISFIFLIFFIGCLTGWIYEEIFYYITESWIGNRGFLYGPYLPVYGFGAVLMTLCLYRYKSNPLLLFVFAIVITGVLEYVTGVLMFQIWQKRWWEYTGLLMNIDGYVCLRSVITFAMGGLGLMYVVIPLVKKFVLHLKEKTATRICVIGASIIIIDLIITLLLRY